MPPKLAVIRSLSAIAAASAISVSIALVLPLQHPINIVFSATAQEDDFDDEIEEDIDDEVEDDIEEEIDDDIEDEIDEDLEEDIEDEIEEALDDEIDDEFEDDLEDDFEEDLEDEFEEDDEAFDEDDDFDEEDDEESDDDEENDEGEDDDEDFARQFEFELDEEGDAFTANELLVLGAADDIDAIIEAGLETENVSDLASLDLKLVRVSSIGDLSLETLRARVSEIAPDAEIDVNHLYLEQGMPQPQQSTGQVMSWPDHAGPLSRDAGLSIGLIDTRLNPGRVELANSRIIARDFVPYESERPEAHGTAIAAILVGESEQFVGLVPDAELYAASVFFKTPSGTASATTESLVAALDWLIASNVQVINMSLSGPPNAILERAIASVQAQGISVVAAVGNDGPAAAPRYPAAYEGVIGVTAVAPQKKVFRHAGRGHHVDFSAYGVGVRHAGGAEDASVSSGTSFAAPYVTAQFAIAAQVLAPDYLFEAFILSAEDLGPKGYDPIYGHGLLRPLDQYQTAAASEIAPTGQD